MPRRDRRRERYLRDRRARMRERKRDRNYPMVDEHYYPERNDLYDYRRNEYSRYDENYNMDYKRPREHSRMYDDSMRYQDYRDYADDDYDEDYEKDLEKWVKRLKKDDRFGLSKEQVIQKAKDMNVSFNDYDEDEFYAIYLMHVSDYPSVANEPHTYLAMAKMWLEDKDIDIDPSEKVCKYLYEIVMADED